MDLDELKLIEKNKLAQIVKLAVEDQAFKYLIAIQKPNQKGKNIDFKTLALQPYFRPREKTKLEKQREIFALRTKMNH